MNTTLPIMVVMGVFAFCASTLAEREIENAELASHVVTGIVEKVFAHEGVENDQYVVQIRITGIQKGDDYRNGDTIFAYAYKRQTDAPRVPASSGHSPIPKAGQLIRASIELGNGRMEALYPFGFELLNPSDATVGSGIDQNGDLAVPDEGRLRGMRAAIDDLEQGVVKLKEYPPEPFGPGHLEFVQLLKTECGIEWETIRIDASGLSKTFREEIRIALSQEAEGYNNVMRAEITHRFGSEISAELRKKANLSFRAEAKATINE